MHGDLHSLHIEIDTMIVYMGIYLVYMSRLKHVFAKTINHFDPKTVIEDLDVYDG